MNNKLVPTPAIERAPEPIQKAQAAALEAEQARQVATKRMTAAIAAADGAPKADAAALTDAARKGAKPPRPTAPKLAEEAEAAKAAYRVLKDDAEAAVRALHVAVAKHNAEAIAAQRPVVEEGLAEVREAVERARARLDERLAPEYTVLCAYRRADAFRVRRGSRRVLTEPGRLSFQKPTAALNEAKQALRTAEAALARIELDASTAAERLDVEEREREERRARRVPRGPGIGVGVYAPAD